jgi:hypothetical protein
LEFDQRQVIIQNDSKIVAMTKSCIEYLYYLEIIEMEFRILTMVPTWVLVHPKLPSPLWEPLKQNAPCQAGTGRFWIITPFLW